MKLYLFSIKIESITYKSAPLTEERTRFFMTKDIDQAVEKISNYTHHELTEDEEKDAKTLLTSIRSYYKSSDEVEEKILVLLEDVIEL